MTCVRLSVYTGFKILYRMTQLFVQRDPLYTNIVFEVDKAVVNVD